MLRTKQIILRALEPEDIDILYTWENDPECWEVSNTHLPFSKSILREYIKSAHDDIFTDGQIRLVICKTNLEPIGFLDLFDFDSFHKRAGIGIIIRHEDRKKGHAKQALQLAIKYCKEHLDLNQLFCNILDDNLASQKLFESQGFTKTGVKISWVKCKETYKDEYFYQLLLKK